MKDIRKEKVKKILSYFKQPNLSRRWKKIQNKERQQTRNNVSFFNLTKNSKKGSRAIWEDVTIADAHEDVSPANENEISIIEKKISTYNITMEEIELWKNENCEEFLNMVNGEKAQEFQTLMRVLDGVIKKRKELLRRVQGAFLLTSAMFWRIPEP